MFGQQLRARSSLATVSYNNLGFQVCSCHLLKLWLKITWRSSRGIYLVFIGFPHSTRLPHIDILESRYDIAMPLEEKDKYPLLLDDGTQAVAAATDASNPSSDSPAIPQVQARPPSKGRINPRFFRNIVRDVEGHNSALLRKERDEKLSLKKHPLVDKIRAIEREKLERVRNARRRSRSPRRSSESPKPTKTVSREDLTRRGNDARIVQVRGRGSKSANVLDNPESHLQAATTDQQDEEEEGPVLDDWAASRDAHSAHKAHNDALNSVIFKTAPDLASSNDESGTNDRDWDRGKQVKSNGEIELDATGKWKCGAGYL